MRNRLLWLLLLTLLAALLGWGVRWFLANHERESKPIRVDVAPEARRNPLLAAERFLRRRGIEVQSVTGRDRLLRPPREPGVLLVHRFGPSLPQAREQELLRWVEAGGHLIVTAGRAWDEERQTSGNRLLDRFGVRLRQRSDEPQADDPEGPGSEVREQVDFPGFPQPLEVAFDVGRSLEDSQARADWTLRGRSGIHLLQLAVGGGRLSILSDNRWMTNDGIGEADNALLLALLVGDADRVWLLYNANMPSLLVLVWRFAPYPVVSLGLWLVFWLCRLTSRSGPLLQVSGSTRRNLLEHLDAAAAFGWRTDRAEHLFKSSRSSVEQLWRRRHPALAELARREACSRIARRSGLAPRAVEAALYGSVVKDREFLRASATLQKLVAASQRRGSEEAE